MPLYEFIAICKPGLAKETAKLLRATKISVEQYGGVVRTAQVLGDRIMAHTIRGRDCKHYIVGRYLQILIDGNPDILSYVRNDMRMHNEALRVNIHRVPDFYKEAQDMISGVDQEQFKGEQAKVLFEAEEKSKFEEMINKLGGQVKYE